MNHHPEVVAHVRAEIIRVAYPGIVPTEQQIADLFRDPLEYMPKKTGEWPSWYRPGLPVQDQITVGGPWFGVGPGQIAWLAWVKYRPKTPKMQDLQAQSDSTALATVDPGYHWRKIDASTPQGTKLQLINAADGVAVYGVWWAGDDRFTHFAPLPTMPDA